MAYTEFYCNASTGSNVNGGSDAGSVTYTSTNGNWNGSTTFTPTDGTNPVSAGVAVGQFASIYLDGATVTVSVSRITAVTNAANGAITVSTTARAGSVPSSGVTGRTIKVGGAWLGPNGSSGFPFTLSSLGSATDASADRLRVNMKNNATYSVTANIPQGSSSAYTVQGYSSSAGDGGRSTIDGGTTGTSYVLFTASASTTTVFEFVDLIFNHNGSTGAADGVFGSGGPYLFRRCVFANFRGNGVLAPGTYVECESYGNNLSNTASKAGFSSSTSALYYYCYSHDNTGSNTAGFLVSGSGSPYVFSECVSESNGGIGLASTVVGGTVSVQNCDFYNNTSDGLKLTSVGPSGIVIQNSNFIKNGGWGINFSSSANLAGVITNNGFGSGTQANTSGTSTGLGVLSQISSVTYASGVTPYNAPGTGDFRIALSAAMNAGRGAFTQTDGTNTGTVGYPDIGAAMHLDLTPATGAGGDVVLPDGFLGGHTYAITQTISDTTATLTIPSGSLPTGLSLTNPSSGVWSISGTPTVAGTYNYTLRITRGATTSDLTEHITINADPGGGTRSRVFSG